MKLNRNTILLAFVTVLIMSACSGPMSESDRLTNQIEYAVEIGNPVEVEYSQNWLSKEKRIEFLTDILEKVKKQELPLYYYISDTLIPMEKDYMDDLFHHVDTEYVLVDEEYLKIPIEENLDVDGIVKLKFLEQWYFNSSSNEFTKKVVAICPMVERYKNDKEILGYKGLFWIYLNKK